MITSTDAIILDEVCSTKKKPTRVKMNNGQKRSPNALLKNARAKRNVNN